MESFLRNPMAKEEAPQDPWHPKNVEKTKKKRLSDLVNLKSNIRAYDARLQVKVNDYLEEQGKGFHHLDETHDEFDKGLAKKVEGMVDDHYEGFGKAIKGYIKETEMDGKKGNYFVKELLKGTFFGHARDVKKAVRSKDFSGSMESASQKNLQNVENQAFQRLASDVDPEKHGESLYGFLKTEYKFSDKKVDKDSVVRGLDQIMTLHAAGRLDKDYFHTEHKKYAGKKEKTN
jgi:hypothetical protein